MSHAEVFFVHIYTVIAYMYLVLCTYIFLLHENISCWMYIFCCCIYMWVLLYFATKNNRTSVVRILSYFITSIFNHKQEATQWANYESTKNLRRSYFRRSFFAVTSQIRRNVTFIWRRRTKNLRRYCDVAKTSLQSHSDVLATSQYRRRSFVKT